MPPAGDGVIAEFLLRFRQGITFALSVLQKLVKALHENSSGLVIHPPKTEMNAAGAGNRKRPFQAVLALATFHKTKAEFTSRCRQGLPKTEPPVLSGRIIRPTQRSNGEQHPVPRH